MKKIAVIGSAPSSVALAPYNDPSWIIWSCSPGSVPHLRRVDAHFELHVWEPDKSWFHTDYRLWLANCKCPVYVIVKNPEIPTSVELPKEELLRQFGGHFFTSSIAWMMALAIAQKPDEIGLWGVDMAADEEIYSGQKLGCQYFISIAKAMGIKVTIPPQSDLNQPNRLYGVAEHDAKHIKLLARMDEMRARIHECEVTVQNKTNELMFLRGALSDCDYHLKTWTHDPIQVELANWNPEPKVELPVEPISVPVPVENYVGATQGATLADYMPQKKGIKRNGKSNGKHPPEAP